MAVDPQVLQNNFLYGVGIQVAYSGSLDLAAQLQAMLAPGGTFVFPFHATQTGPFNGPDLLMINNSQDAYLFITGPQIPADAQWMAAFSGRIQVPSLLSASQRYRAQSDTSLYGPYDTWMASSVSQYVKPGYDTASFTTPLTGLQLFGPPQQDPVTYGGKVTVIAHGVGCMIALEMLALMYNNQLNTGPSATDNPFAKMVDGVYLYGSPPTLNLLGTRWTRQAFDIYCFDNIMDPIPATRTGNLAIFPGAAVVANGELNLVKPMSKFIGPSSQAAPESLTPGYLRSQFSSPLQLNIQSNGWPLASTPEAYTNLAAMAVRGPRTAYLQSWASLYEKALSAYTFKSNIYSDDGPTLALKEVPLGLQSQQIASETLLPVPPSLPVSQAIAEIRAAEIPSSGAEMESFGPVNTRNWSGGLGGRTQGIMFP